MSAIEETKTDTSLRPAPRARVESPVSKLLTQLIKLLSSVRFGVTLLCVLVVLSMIGMLIMQQNVDGFDKYFAERTPSQKLIYGSLGFFDIYHAWYFNALLLVLSLNIVLASIDRFPGAWRYISRRKLEASRPYIKNQPQQATLALQSESQSAAAERIKRACQSVGLKPVVTLKDGRAHVFAERGAWNRLGAYAVHVALLTIFTGFFLTAQFGRDGQMWLQPGTSSSSMLNVEYGLGEIKRVSAPLPFTVTCLDIQQKLIKKDGTIMQDNTIDWLTRFKITDEYGEREALTHLNEPYDYRGYRFFQASFASFGKARNITLRLTPTAGGAPQEVTIKRDGSATLADGTKIVFEDFQPDFVVGQGGTPDSASSEYNKPAAILQIIKPSGEQKRAYAFQMELPDGAPVGAPVFGYKFKLVDFEKVPLQHMLAIQKDPGKIPFYLGGFMLIMTLGAVFFFSHQRVWAVIEEGSEAGRYEVALGGNTNRNKLGFEDRFKKLIKAIGGSTEEVQQS